MSVVTSLSEHRENPSRPRIPGYSHAVDFDGSRASFLNGPTLAVSGTGLAVETTYEAGEFRITVTGGLPEDLSLDAAKRLAESLTAAVAAAANLEAMHNAPRPW